MKFLEEEEFTFPKKKKIISFILDHDISFTLDHGIPSELALNLDQTPLSYVSPGKHTFSSKGSKNVPIKRSR